VSEVGHGRREARLASPKITLLASRVTRVSGLRPTGEDISLRGPRQVADRPGIGARLGIAFTEGLCRRSVNGY
jgi:hypothetical protein